jgi:hypothetical protein
MLQLFFPFFSCEDVIGALGFTTGNKHPPNNDASLGKVDLFADLHLLVPSRAFHGGADELGADIALAEVVLVRTDFVPTSNLCNPEEESRSFSMRSSF